MIKISQAVDEIIKGDEIAFEAHKAGLLNLSAYAKQIQPAIEKKLYKPAKIGSIVVALSRIKDEIDTLADLKPRVKIQDLIIKYPLCEITYEEDEVSLKALTSLPANLQKKDKFLTITQGVSEITLICSSELQIEILKHFKTKPSGKYEDLVAISVRFAEEEYIEVPNMIFTLVSALATKRINLIEIVSTYTEISFIVRNKDMQITIDALRQFLN